MIKGMVDAGVAVDIPTICVLWKCNDLPYQIAPLDAWGLDSFVTPAEIIEFATAWWSDHPESSPPEIKVIAAADPGDSIASEMESLCAKSDLTIGARKLRFSIIHRVLDSELSVWEKAGYADNCAVRLRSEFGLEDDVTEHALFDALDSRSVSAEECVARIETWLDGERRRVVP